MIRKLRHYKIAVGLIAGAVASTGQATAAWAVVENFDSYSPGTIGSHGSGDVTGGKWQGVFNGTGAATIVAQPDGGNALSFYGVPGQGGNGWRGAVTTLSSPIPDNAITTAFFQFKINGSNHDVMFGFTDAASNLDNVDSWRDFAVMPYISGSPAAFKADTSGGTDVLVEPASNTWYNVWLAINTTTNTFDVYTSTGTADGVLGSSGAVFRNGLGTSTLGAFGVAQRQDGVVQIDNLYITPGLNTTFPVPEPSIALLGVLSLSAFLKRRR